MTKHDRIISELVDALDAIRRDADRDDCSRHYIRGLAGQAIANCNAQRVRNKDGYLVVRKSAEVFKARENCYQCDGDGFSGDPLGGNCPRCGGGGKELSR